MPEALETGVSMMKISHIGSMKKKFKVAAKKMLQSHRSGQIAKLRQLWYTGVCLHVVLRVGENVAARIQISNACSNAGTNA